MNMDATGSSGRRRGGIRRFGARQMSPVLLLLAVILAIGGFLLVIPGQSTPVAGIAAAGLIAALLLSPPLLIWAGVRRRHGVRRRWPGGGRRGDPSLRPSNPPIEQIAADLRRMLWQHDTIARSNDIAMPRTRLRALESAISVSALQAARALRVSHPDPPPFGGLETYELRQLLRALRTEGLVLPSQVGLLAPDSRF
jgi:hypothetical protein